jgi:ABC-type nitrate/sulfonate/bicarbonate transport system permease component
MENGFFAHRKYVYLFSALLLVWIVLFEFVLSPNQMLPKPSVVILSFGSLITDYGLFRNLLSTLSVLYFSFITACLAVWIFRSHLIQNNFIRYFAFLPGWLSRFVPSVLIMLFLVFWLKGSEYIKYLLLFLTGFTLLINKLEHEIKNSRSEFSDAAASLGADNDFLSRNIIWKSIEPSIAGYLPGVHIYLWSVLLVFEFIDGERGMGSILYKALLYRDLSSLFSSTIIIAFIILSGEIVLNLMKNKFFSWSID